MKKTLFTSMLALCMAGAAMATDYVTTNGFAYWSYNDETGTWSNTNANMDGGGYQSVSFSLTTDSINAVQSSDGGAYTSVTLDDGTIDTTASSFDTDEVSLTSITIIGRGNTDTYHDNLDSLEYVTITTTDADGNTIILATSYDIDVPSTATRVYDVWDTDQTGTAGNYYTVDIDFDSILISTDTTYTINFYDENDDALTLSLLVTGNGDDINAGGSFSIPGYNNLGAAGLTISTSSYDAVIPEPATASLSLLALAGLMIRRRRKSLR